MREAVREAREAAVATAALGRARTCSAQSLKLLQTERQWQSGGRRCEGGSRRGRGADGGEEQVAEWQQLAAAPRVQGDS